jgi:hypothetical protein
MCRHTFKVIKSRVVLGVLVRACYYYYYPSTQKAEAGGSTV